MSSSNTSSSTNNTRWSPITSFPIQPLTPSGLLSLDVSDDEVEIYTSSYIELRSLFPMMTSTSSSTPARTWHDRDLNLTMTLTTHRIVFQSSSSSTKYSNFLHLSNIESKSTTGGDWYGSNKSYKIEIDTISHGKFYFIFRTKKLNQKVDRDTFYNKLEKALDRRQWEESSRLHSSSFEGQGIGSAGGGGGRSRPSANVGVAAIVERNRLKHEHNAKLAKQAFSGGTTSKSNANTNKAAKKEREREVETLMREAKELTNVIHKYVSTLEKSAQKNNDTTTTTDDDDNQELASMLSHMGMITAIPSKHQSSSSSSSSSSTTRMYYETLARQISDFLLQNKSFSISKGGNGIMTLTDVYCLYNRARGANMISPEDLITALEQMERLGLKMKIREFDNGSGVSVLQDTGFDDSVMVEKITNYVDDVGGRSGGTGRKTVGVTALEAGRILKISPLLAKEQLLSAEQNGFLCRDVTMEGTRFYCNLFVSGDMGF
jgi:ESCRT-II complex subunit VPS36